MMIFYLHKDEQDMTSVNDLIQMEIEIGNLFDWNFNFQGPVEFIDRFIRLLNVKNERSVKSISVQYCKFALNNSKFLNYRPSELAACSVIIALSIDKYNTIAKKSMARRLDFTPWQQPDVIANSGYTIDMIKDKVYELAEYL